MSSVSFFIILTSWVCRILCSFSVLISHSLSRPLCLVSACEPIGSCGVCACVIPSPLYLCHLCLCHYHCTPITTTLVSLRRSTKCVLLVLLVTKPFAYTLHSTRERTRSKLRDTDEGRRAIKTMLREREKERESRLEINELSCSLPPITETSCG